MRVRDRQLAVHEAEDELVRVQVDLCDVVQLVLRQSGSEFGPLVCKRFISAVLGSADPVKVQLCNFSDLDNCRDPSLAALDGDGLPGLFFKFLLREPRIQRRQAEHLQHS